MALNQPGVRLLLLLQLGACTPDKPVEHQPPVTTAPPAARPAAPPPAAPADTLATYAWDTPVCHFTGRYNPRRYTRQQLDDTRELLFGSALLSTRATPFEPADIATLSVDTLTAEYTRKIKAYHALHVVPQPVWRTMQQAKIRQLDDQYRAMKLTIEGFADPAVLLASADYGDCKKYAQALASRNDSLILKDWRRFMEEEGKRNGSLNAYRARFNKAYQSEDRLLHAKIDLLSFGWWNCVNNSIHYVDVTAKTEQQFQDLFTHVKSECADVD